MPFTVEDGSGVVGANSYCSVAFSDDYHEERGNTAWGPLVTTDKEARLIRATDYLRRFAQQWLGDRSYTDQSLDWPRWGVVVGTYSQLAINIVPWEVQAATAELALRAATSTTLEPDQKRKIKQFAAAGVNVTYADEASPGTTYPQVDTLLAPLLRSVTMQRLIRG